MADETPTRLDGTAADPAQQHAGLPSAPSRVNPLAELVADLLEPTGLVPLDRLASVRSRMGGGSFAESLREEGLASDKGVARALASTTCRSSTSSGKRSIPKRSSRSTRRCASASAPCRSPSTAGRCASRSPTRRTSPRSTSCGSQPAPPSSSPSRRATT
jgi:hypothetical protein